MKHFSTLGLLSLVLACSTTPKGGDHQAEMGLPILQGPTSPYQTRISVILPRDETPSFRILVGTPSREIPPIKAKRYDHPSSKWVVHQVEFKDLSPGVSYTFQVLDEDRDILDERTLQTLPDDGKKLTFALVSCSDDTYLQNQRNMWQGVASHRPDVVVLLGDNVYADKEVGFYQGPAPQEIVWRRYVETWQALNLFHWKHLVPVVATWDDHDYGRNDGDRTFPFKRESQDVFFAFHPQKTSMGKTWIRGLGVSGALRTRSQQILLTDNRSFRSPNNIATVKPTHFGSKQEAWIDERLKEFKGPSWIMSGDQFFGGYSPLESYQTNHALSFERFLRRISRMPGAVAFGSGNSHFNELIRIPKNRLGYTTYEVTSSGIHAYVTQGHWNQYPNPYQVEGRENIHNYSLIESEAVGRGLTLVVSSWGPDKRMLYQRALNVRR